MEFEDVKDYIEKWAAKIDRIPSKAEIDNDSKLKSGSTVLRQFKSNLGITMKEHLNKFGYDSRTRAKTEDIIPFKEIYNKLNDACEKLNRIPNIEEIKDFNLPEGNTLRSIFKRNIGMGYVEYFRSKGYNIANSLTKHIDNFNGINSYIIDLCKLKNRIPTVEEIENDSNLPNVATMRNLYKKIKGISYFDYLKSLGYVQNINNIESKYNFKTISNELLKLCESLGRIPSRVEINAFENIPSAEITLELFRRNGYKNYIVYCMEHNYTHEVYNKSRFTEFTKDKIEYLWEEYFNKFEKYPTAEVCNNNPELPTWSNLKAIYGDDFEEFYNKYGNRLNPIIEKYEVYCDLFKKVCYEKGETLTTYDLIDNTYGLPESRWLVKNCPDNKVKGYNDFINYLGLKPYYEVSKEYAVDAILRKHKVIGRNLKKSDFTNPTQEEIGISTIYNHWGDFNTMLIDLGFEINQENTRNKTRSIEELTNDIKKLCEYIVDTENRDIISREDVDNCEWCLGANTYDRWFKREFNMTLCEYIEHIGYKTNKVGMGMVFKYEDGEITKSKFEFDVSAYLRKQNIKYDRDIKYESFTKYKGNKDCDYVIHFNNDTWYIEIAGMLMNDSSSYDDHIKKRYRRGLDDKIKILSDSNLNYKIIYPHDFQNRTMDDIFSFLTDLKHINLVAT